MMNEDELINRPDDDDALFVSKSCLFDVPDLTFLAFQLGEISWRHPLFCSLKVAVTFRLLRLLPQAIESQ